MLGRSRPPPYGHRAILRRTMPCRGKISLLQYDMDYMRRWMRKVKGTTRNMTFIDHVATLRERGHCDPLLKSAAGAITDNGMQTIEESKCDDCWYNKI